MAFARSLVLCLSLFAARTNAFSGHRLPSARVVRGRSSLTIAPGPMVAPTEMKSTTAVASAPPASPLHEAFPMRTNPLLVVSLLGGLMCGLSGYLNAITFLQLERTSMHVTGVMTKTSAAFMSGELMLFLELAYQLVIFIVGSTIASLMVGGEQKFAGGQHHTKVLALIACVVGAGAAFSSGNALLGSSLVTCAAGMQNGMTTFYSGAVVRSTHITGTLTDMGTETAQLLMGRSNNPWKLQVLSAFAMCYFVGGNIGSILANKVSSTTAITAAAASYGFLALCNCLFHMGKLRFFKRAWYAIRNPDAVKVD